MGYDGIPANVQFVAWDRSPPPKWVLSLTACVAPGTFP